MRVGVSFTPGVPLSRKRTAATAVALAGLAMSTGFAADRLLPDRPRTELVFEEHTPAPGTRGDDASGPAQVAAAPRFTEPAPPLKRIDLPAAPQPSAVP